MKHKFEVSAFNTAPLLNNYLWNQMESKENRWAPFVLKAHHAQLFWSVQQFRLLLNEKRFLHVQVRVRLIRGQKDILTEDWETKPPQKQGCCSNVGGQTRTTRRNQNTQIPLMTTSRHSDWGDNEKGMKISDEIETVRQQLRCRPCHLFLIRHGGEGQTADSTVHNSY